MWLIKDTYSNYKANYKADMLNTKRNSYWLLQILKFCNLHTVFFLEKLVKKWKKRSLFLVVLLSCLCRKKIKIRWDNTTGKHETDLRFITRLSLIVLIFSTKQTNAKATWFFVLRARPTLISGKSKFVIIIIFISYIFFFSFYFSPNLISFFYVTIK